MSRSRRGRCGGFVVHAGNRSLFPRSALRQSGGSVSVFKPSCPPEGTTPRRGRPQVAVLARVPRAAFLGVESLLCTMLSH